MGKQLSDIVRLPTILLGVVNILALYLLAGQVRHGIHTSILSTPPKSISFAMPVLSVPVRSTNFERLQTEALFYESRRYYVAPAIEMKPPKPDYRLMGTLVIPNKPTVALLVQNQTGAQLKVRQGESLDGWTVSAVEPKRVVLNQGGEQIDIALTSGGLRTPPNGMPASPPAQAIAATTNVAASGGIKVLGNGTGIGSTTSSSNLVGRPQSPPRLYQPPTR